MVGARYYERTDAGARVLRAHVVGGAVAPGDTGLASACARQERRRAMSSPAVLASVQEAIGLVAKGRGDEYCG
jgi:hypothetical protein